MNPIQQSRLDLNVKRIVSLELWLIGELELQPTAVCDMLIALRARLAVMEAINHEDLTFSPKSGGPES